MAIEAFLSAAAASGSPGETPGGVGDTGAQGEAFAQLLAQPPAGGGPQAAPPAVAAQSFLRAGGQTGLGEDVLGSLRRFGQTISKMETMGTYKPRSRQAGQASATDAAQAPVLPGPAERDPGAGRRAQSGRDYMNEAMDMAQEALGRQAQLYKVVMDFTLVESSAESLNKSLKTLLTQGGG